MGRTEESAAGGLRWPRAIAHLAIVVVFVLSALGYAPLREHAAGVATVVADAKRAETKVARVCDAHEDVAAGAVHVEDATASTAQAATARASDCPLSEGQLAFVQRKRNGDGASPDLRHTFKTPQAR